MPRRKSTPPKAPHLSVAVTDAQLRAWTEVAERSGTSLSAWVRFVLDDAADDAALEAKGKRLSNEDLQKSLDRFTRRMQALLDKRNDKRR